MLSVEELKKSYDRVVDILRGVTLQLSMGEILAVVGSSGCGKTTLLRLIAGLETPGRGRILIDGIEASTQQKTIPPHQRQTSLIFQDLALWPHMTAREHIRYVLRETKGVDRRTVAAVSDQYLDTVCLNGHRDRYPHQLSGGERQRLAIARAIASKPKYLLMDEPFNSLDGMLKAELQSMVLNLKSHGHMGIIYVTHSMDEVKALADTIAVMHEGRIEQMGSKETVLGSPRNELVSCILGMRESS